MAAQAQTSIKDLSQMNEKAVPTSDELRPKAAPVGAVLQDKAPPNSSVLKRNTASDDNGGLSLCG